jgi:hypothetical protein
MGTQAGCAFVTFVLFLYYVWMNKRREPLSDDMEEQYMSPDVWARLTDKENPRFRYSY